MIKVENGALIIDAEGFVLDETLKIEGNSKVENETIFLENCKTEEHNS